MGAKAAVPVIRNRFAVVPVTPEPVEVRRDSQGHIHLRVLTAPKGLAGHIAGWFHFSYHRTLELDDHGTFYYSQVDGQTPLSTIIDRMAAHLGVPRGEAEALVVLFTKKLMVSNMLALLVPEESQ